jgi:hypothetical protein
VVRLNLNATGRRAFTTALLVGTLGALAGRAQPPTAVPALPAANEPCAAVPVPNQKRYEAVEYQSLLVDSNSVDSNGMEGGFVHEFKHAVSELAHKERISRGQVIPYLVTRVTAPPGFGKSALLRYLEDILTSETKVKGRVPDEIRGLIGYKLRLDGNGWEIPKKGEVFGLLVISLVERKDANRKPTDSLRFHMFDWDGNVPTSIDVDASGFPGKLPKIHKLKESVRQHLRDGHTGPELSQLETDCILQTVRDIVDWDLPRFDIKSHTVTVKLNELPRRFELRSTLVDDLKNDDAYSLPALGKLPAFDYDDHAAPGVEALVEAFDRRFESARPARLILIIDSIDEIHPDSARSLLVRIDDYIKEREEEGREGGFLRVFVLGRPEGFTDYYRITQGGVYKTRPVKLVGPKLKEQDKRDAVRSAARFVLGAKAGEADEAVDNMTNNTLKFINSYNGPSKWLDESFENIAALNDLVKVANDVQGTTLRKAEFDFELKEIFFQSLLARARASHNRPLWQTEKYVELLVKIANRYDSRKDKNGCFLVTPTDSVEIRVTDGRGTHNLSYCVESVLNRSGVAEIDSPNLYVPRYRFYPPWLHQHLVDRTVNMYRRRMPRGGR